MIFYAGIVVKAGRVIVIVPDVQLAIPLDVDMHMLLDIEEMQESLLFLDSPVLLLLLATHCSPPQAVLASVCPVASLVLLLAALVPLAWLAASLAHGKTP